MVGGHETLGGVEGAWAYCSHAKTERTGLHDRTHADTHIQYLRRGGHKKIYPLVTRFQRCWCLVRTSTARVAPWSIARSRASSTFSAPASSNKLTTCGRLLMLAWMSGVVPSWEVALTSALAEMRALDAMGRKGWGGLS